MRISDWSSDVCSSDLWPSIRHCVRSSETSCKFSMLLTPSECDVEVAVDVDDLARDEAGRAAAQEADHAGDIAGPAQAPEGRLLDPIQDAPRGEVIVHGRGAYGGRHTVGLAELRVGNECVSTGD